MNLTFRDELPSTLLLPASLRESNSRQNLSAVALLGKDFWKYPMSENSTSEKKEKTGASGLFLKEAFFIENFYRLEVILFLMGYTNVLFWPFTVWINKGLEFQKFFLITRTIFSHSSSEQFWKKIPFSCKRIIFNYLFNSFFYF